MRFNPDSPAERSRRRNPRRSCCRWAKRAGLYFAGLRRKNGPRWIHPGGIWGRRGTIGGYWGGYRSLSSSPTHKALPGKVENLTPPATAKSTAMPPCEKYPGGIPWSGDRSEDHGRTQHSRQDNATHGAPCLLLFSPDPRPTPCLIRSTSGTSARTDPPRWLLICCTDCTGSRRPPA